MKQSLIKTNETLLKDITLELGVFDTTARELLSSKLKGRSSLNAKSTQNRLNTLYNRIKTQSPQQNLTMVKRMFARNTSYKEIKFDPYGKVKNFSGVYSLVNEIIRYEDYLANKEDFIAYNEVKSKMKSGIKLSQEDKIAYNKIAIDFRNKILKRRAENEDDTFF